MILYLIEKIKKYHNLLFYIGIFMIIVFGMRFLGIYRQIVGFDLIKIEYAFAFVGMGFVLVFPKFFFISDRYKKEFGKYDARIVSGWIKILCLGILFIIVALFIL